MGPSPQAMVGKILFTHHETMTRVWIYDALIGSEEFRPIIAFTNWAISFFSFFFF